MNHHIIYKQKATITIAKQEQSHAIQNTISEVLKHELPQLLQPVFDEMATEHEIIRIDSLQLDLGTISPDHIRQDFAKRVTEEIRKAILVKKEKASSENGAVVIQKEQSLREAFLYFLQWGTNPWFIAIKKRKDWESGMQQGFAPDDWQKIIVWLQEKSRQQSIIIERLVYQFSDEFLETIISHIISFDKENWKTVYHDLVALFMWLEVDTKTAIRNEVLTSCLTSFLHKQPFHEALDEVVKTKFASSVHKEQFVFRQQTATADKIITTDAVRKTIERLMKEKSNNVNKHETEKTIVDERSENTRSSEDNKVVNAADEEKEKEKYLTNEQTDSIYKEQSEKNRPLSNVIEKEPQYVSNSGIILLHPFLEMYFAEFDLLHKRKFKDDEACKHAVLLLHYLATGETEGEEWNLLLQKLVCGLSFGQTLPNQLDLTEKEKEESEKLLQSLINYWPPLKNTSIEGLRGTFLQREGKLEKKDNGWLLTVEQKTVDILLDKLPWGFSTIRLPWLTEIISVDWC